MTTTSPKQAKTKACPKCNSAQPTNAFQCGNCGHQFKPRPIRYHEIKPTIIERFGTPRLNVRTGGVVLGDRALTADEIDRFYLELCSESEQWPIKPTADAIWAMAEQNEFDPVADYLEDLGDHTPLPMAQWQRLDKHLLGIDNPVAAEFLPQYFVGAVARALTPGCEARCSLVLVGPQQRGKTTLGRILFGSDYWVEGLADLSRDSRMRCMSAWATELSELDGITRRADIESLKTFLTEREDSFRKPYGSGVKKYPRRFVFWATANGSPLRDLSGNTRFLTVGIPDRMLPLDWAASHRNALWARAVEQFRSGFDWCGVSEQQRLERIAANLNFEEVDPWGEVVGSVLAASNGFERFSDIYDKLEVPKERQNPANARRIKQLAASFGWEYTVRRLNGTLMRGFWKQSEPMKVQEGEGQDLEEYF
jgi:predicted P-loop ATPase